MKKREFLKRLLGITAAAVVAPQVLLAEEQPTKVVADGGETKHKISHSISPCCEVIDVPYYELLGTGYKSTCVIVSGDILSIGNIVYLAHNDVSFEVVKAEKMPGTLCVSQKVSIKPLGETAYIKKGDFLVVNASASDLVEYGPGKLKYLYAEML